MATTKVTYPSGPISPHGAWHFIKGDHPEVSLSAYDGSTAFYLMGGRSIPVWFRPEAVSIKKGGLKGLVPPWKKIEQKGATEDGTTFIDALYDPMKVIANVVCKGRDAQHTRKIVRDLLASIDVKQKSELAWYTHELGRWWANVRWAETAPNAYEGAQRRRQELQLVLQADDGFWRSYDDVDDFQFAYDSMRDTFSRDDSTNLGPNWPQRYSGSGGGVCGVTRGVAAWFDDPKRPLLSDGREVVNGPYKDFETDTDNQVVEIVIGSVPEVTFPDGAENHIWGRMGRDELGRWDGNGIKLQIGWFGAILSRYNNFHETVMAIRPLIFPPMPGEKFTLVCGYEGGARIFKAMRNGFELFTHVEVGTGSALGPEYRGVGFGMRAGAALKTQATPAVVRTMMAGDNGSVSQSGFLKCINVGDQPMYKRFTIFGPASMVRIGNGPNSKDTVDFGPVLPGQVVHLRTDPRKTDIVDLTSTPPTPQELALFKKAREDYTSFATANNAPILLQQLESAFGVVPPQANLYPLLRGRFSSGSAIPPKSPGSPAAPYYVSVKIDGGNADSMVVAAGTPLRRYPQ